MVKFPIVKVGEPYYVKHTSDSKTYRIGKSAEITKKPPNLAASVLGQLEIHRLVGVNIVVAEYQIGFRLWHDE